MKDAHDARILRATSERTRVIADPVNVDEPNRSGSASAPMAGNAQPSVLDDAPKDDDMHDPEAGMKHAEDQSDFFLEVDDAFNNAEDQIADPAPAPDMDIDVNDHDMVALVDTLQTLGVEPLEATRSASIIMRRHRPKATLVEIFGRGNIVDAANGKA